MEILKTDASRPELPNGVPIMRVGVHGEGGEAVTVHMSPAVDGAYEPDQAIIDRAKGILVQVATPRCLEASITRRPKTRRRPAAQAKYSCWSIAMATKAEHCRP